MTAELSILEKTAAMRRLTDEERDAAMGGNVMDGRALFGARAKQVQLAHAYRSPPPSTEGPPLRRG